MSPADLVADLRGRGVRIAVAEGRLRVEAPKGTLTQDLREELARRKDEILDLLRGPAEPKVLPPEWVLESLDIARGRVDRCFLCRWIIEALRDGQFQPTRPMHGGGYLFPIESQLAHLELEYGIYCEGRSAVS